MSVYGYARVSTGPQAERHSLGVQQERILRYCGSKDLALDHTFTDDGEQGSVPLAERTAGGALCRSLKQGDHVVVASLDRAWRSLADADATLTEWQKRGITPHLLDVPMDLATPIGRLFFQILSAFAEFEKRLIKERVGHGIRAAISKRGGVWGPVPSYGYRWGPQRGVLEEVPEEQEVLGIIDSLVREGWAGKPLVRLLNDRGIPARNGRRWREDHIRKVLRTALPRYRADHPRD